MAMIANESTWRNIALRRSLRVNLRDPDDSPWVYLGRIEVDALRDIDLVVHRRKTLSFHLEAIDIAPTFEVVRISPRQFAVNGKLGRRRFWLLIGQRENESRTIFWAMPTMNGLRIG